MPLTKGLRVGSYEVEELLGTGAMGAVYRAHDTRLARAVALKVLRAGDGGDGARALLAEARAASALSHPAIATVYEVGEAGVEGRAVAYIAMELVAGPTLDAFARTGAVPLADLVDLVAQ